MRYLPLHHLQKAGLTFLLGWACCLVATSAQGQAAKGDTNYVHPHYQKRLESFREYPVPAGAVVFLGNSITEQGKWHELKMATPVMNRGIGGDITYGVLARLDEILPAKPSKIFLLIGINDLSRKFTNEMIMRNYARIVQRIKQESPATKIYVQSVLPLRDSMLKPDYLKGLNPKVTSLNEQIVAFARQQKLTYINLHPVMADATGQLKEEYSLDGIHLKPEAYTAWVAYLKKKKYL